MNGATNEKSVDRTKIFETILCSPGMQQTCKIVLNPTRQTILILAGFIENGLGKNGEGLHSEMISFLPEDALSDLRSIAGELLKKGGLVEFYEHLKQI